MKIWGYTIPMSNERVFIAFVRVRFVTYLLTKVSMVAMLITKLA